MLSKILLVGLGGFAGSIARYLTYLAIDKPLIGNYPWGTFTVNLVGSLVLGLFIGYFTKTGWGGEQTRLFLAVGFCGSYTTFSTFAYESLTLINQKPFISLVYIAASLILGILFVLGGYLLGKQF